MSSYSPPLVSRFCFSSSIFCFISTILLVFSSIISLSRLLLMQRTMMIMMAIKETPPPAAAAMMVCQEELLQSSALFLADTARQYSEHGFCQKLTFISTIYRAGMFVALPELRPVVAALLPAEAGRGLHRPHPGDGAAPTPQAALS